MPAVESSEVDKEVLEVKEKLSQCRRKTEQLLRVEMKYGRLMRGLDYVGKKIETARQVSMNARSEFEKEKKALQVVLENKEQSVRQLKEDIDKFDLLSYKSTQFDEAVRKFGELEQKFKSQSEQLTSEIDKLHLLQSHMDMKMEKLFYFVKFQLRSSKMTDEVKTLLRSQFTDYVDRLNIKDDDDNKSFAVLTEFMDFYLTSDAELSEEENEDENEVDESIANKLWKFLTT